MTTAVAFVALVISLVALAAQWTAIKDQLKFNDSQSRLNWEQVREIEIQRRRNEELNASKVSWSVSVGEPTPTGKNRLSYVSIQNRAPMSVKVWALIGPEPVLLLTPPDRGMGDPPIWSGRPISLPPCTVLTIRLEGPSRGGQRPYRALVFTYDQEYEAAWARRDNGQLAYGGSDDVIREEDVDLDESTQEHEVRLHIVLFNFDVIEIPGDELQAPNEEPHNDTDTSPIGLLTEKHVTPQWTSVADCG